ncbi:MAG: hypothetical protein K6T86_22070 [Pirellulales bacterium]|nr:hypothetical protein [Pirellulales bacterium]
MRRANLSVADLLAACGAFGAALAVGQMCESELFLQVWLGAAMGCLFWMVWLCRSAPWLIAPGMMFGGVLFLWASNLPRSLSYMARQDVGLLLLALSSWTLAGAGLNLLRHRHWGRGAASLAVSLPWLLMHAGWVIAAVKCC